jgi:hypothetical protein
VLPLVALCLIALISMVALAIDVGMVAIARSQCQNAADASAMAGARTISGDVSVNYNLSAVPTNAQAAAMANKVFGTNVPAGNVTITTGSYTYVYNDNNPSQEGFQIQFPPSDPNEPYSSVQSTVTYTGNFAFARIFGLTNFTAMGQATAAHRPRDVVIVLDLSGSMRFQSLPGIPLTNSDTWGNTGTFGAPSSTSAPRMVSMNPDSVFPTFGHYSNTAAAALQGSTSYQASTGEMIDPCNISSTQNGGPPICADFYANPAGTAPGSSNVAFTSVTAANLAIPPSGDQYLGANGSTGTPPATFGQTVQGITNGKTFQGYQPTPYTSYSGSAVANFNGYTQGPGYWGKTFFIWPPDPRGPATATSDPTNAANWANNGAKDWRQRFFLKYNTATSTYGWLDHNSILFNPSGSPATQTTPKPTPVKNIPMGTSGGTVTTVSEYGTSVSYAYKINYAAILYWLFNQSPNPFPTTLQGGRIRYYSAVPNYNDTTLNARWWGADLGTSTSGNALSDLNERFWKDYIDFVLGVQASGTGTYTNVQNGVPISALIGSGDYYSWGTFQVSQKPDPPSASPYQTGTTTAAFALGFASAITVNSVTDPPLVGDYVTFGTDTTHQYTVKTITGPVAGTYTITLNAALGAAVSSGTTVKFYPYMSYTDNPYRPRHQMWFGPLSMVDYIGNYNLATGAGKVALHWWPGNVHEAHAWACKAGVQTAINDIQNNHPNDFVAMAFFSSPKYSQTGVGHHNRAVVPLGRSYQKLIDSLWFPPGTVTGSQTEITPYDNNMMEGPRADGGTAPGMGFMLAYNQLSNSATNLRFYTQPSYKLPNNTLPNYRGDAGGLGRKGAFRLIIFETDGFPNTRAVSSLATSTSAGLAGSGSDSYFPIRIANPTNLSSSSNVEWPVGPASYVNSEVYTMIQQICAQQSANPPGFATPSRPALVHCIGYGSIFDPANPGQAQTSALTFLQTVQNYGGTAPDQNPANFASWKQIYGTNTQRINRMQTAFTNIMQSGVQVSLIQ